MTLIYGIFQIIGGILISLLTGVLGGTIIMFLFFNLVWAILKASFIISSSKQSSNGMSYANYESEKINYYKSVINPFLSSLFYLKTRKHTTSIIQKKRIPPRR